MKTLKLLFNFCLILSVFSCEKEKENVNPEPVPLSHGVFIINEGSFGQANGSVSYRSADGSQFAPNIFEQVNGYALGDVVQHMYIYNSTGYIVVNNSQKVEVVNMFDFKSAGTIAGFSSPRFFLPVSGDKAYVSDWQSNSVKVVNLSTLSVTGSIPTGSGPEQMLKLGNKVYVVNVGGFASDSTVTVIDVVTDAVIKTIHTGINPNSIIADASGNAVVLCAGTTGMDFIGGTADDIGGAILKINPSNDSIVSYYSFDQFYHPLKLNANAAKTRFLLLGGSDGYTGKVVEFNFAQNTLATIVDDTFYGLGIDPSNGNIYCGRSGFTANNYALRFSSTGSLIDSVLAGIAPNSFEFYY